MKRLSTLILSIGFAVCSTALAQVPPALEKQFSVLMRTYPHVNAQSLMRSPADSAWLFSAGSGPVGTVEVGFQGSEVVYMVFRRGVGGVSWKEQEIDGLHELYCKTLLREPHCGDLYRSILAPRINAALITRKDFDPKSLPGM